MSLNSDNFNMELLRDIFRTHPMWNYNFYLIIESDYEKNFEPIGIGFKNIKILDNENKELVNGNNGDVQKLTASEQCSVRIFCENGITHDGSVHKYIDDINNGVDVKHNILIMEIEKSEGEFKDRIEKSSTTITSVKRAWVIENVCQLNWNSNGFDAMSNEIFIQNVSFEAEDIKVIEMSEEIAREKAKFAVSKMF